MGKLFLSAQWKCLQFPFGHFCFRFEQAGGFTSAHVMCLFLDGGGLNTSQRISKAMEDDDNSWRAPAFRQKVLAQM